MGLSLRDYWQRSDHGWTVTALARASGVSRQTLYNHLQRGRPLAVATAEKLERATGGDVSAAKTLGVVP